MLETDQPQFPEECCPSMGSFPSQPLPLLSLSKALDPERQSTKKEGVDRPRDHISSAYVLSRCRRAAMQCEASESVPKTTTEIGPHRDVPWPLPTQRRSSPGLAPFRKTSVLSRIITDNSAQAVGQPILAAAAFPGGFGRAESATAGTIARPTECQILSGTTH